MRAGLLLGLAILGGAAGLPGTQPVRAAAPPGATACSGCHALPQAGVPESAVPPVHGRDAAGIVAAMQEFRAGTRPATVMDRLARGFSDEEIRAIAAWLAAQR